MFFRECAGYSVPRISRFGARYQPLLAVRTFLVSCVEEFFFFDWKKKLRSDLHKFETAKIIRG